MKERREHLRQQAAKKQPCVGQRMDKKRILVVDDMENSADLLAGLIGRRGFDTFVAKDGAEAVEVASAHRPDLIVLDIELPSLNGYEVLEELRARKIRTRIIMFSGYHRTIKSAVRCIRGGACDFMTKPIKPDDLVARIKKHLVTESTFNTRVARTPAAVVKSLMADVQALEEEVKQLKKDNRRLEEEKDQTVRRNAIAEAVPKLLYILFSLGSLFILTNYAGVQPGVGALAAFLMLVVLLIIPMDQVRQLSASALGMRADVSLEPKVGDVQGKDALPSPDEKK